MTKIYKKTWPQYFDLVRAGKKSFDFRLADFTCHEGDTLVLQEWDPETKQYTGREIEKEVTFVTNMSELEVWPREQAEKYGHYLLSLAEPSVELGFESRQRSIKEFVAYGLRGCDEYVRNGADLRELAQDIRSRYGPLPPPLHPMLSTVNDILWDIEDTAFLNRRDEDEALFARLHTLLRDYSIGRWHPTAWILTATYREEQRGYSLCIERHNTHLQCDIPHVTLDNALRRLMDRIDAEQTDEQFLKNVAYMLPSNVGGLVLQGVSVGEFTLEASGATFWEVRGSDG